MSDGKLQTDPLFLGLTRPAMILGVSFMFFVLNSLTGIMIFVMTSSFIIVPVCVVFHIFGMLLAKKEPLAIEMLLLKIQRFNRCPNRAYHKNRNSYDLF
jgi:type IV secretion system protein VirB3